MLPFNTDIGSRQVKCTEMVGNVEVLAGSGKPGRSYGPAVLASFCQPAGIVSEGKTLFIIDPATTSLSMLTGMQGMCSFLDNLRELYDLFSIHTDIHVPLLKLYQRCIPVVLSLNTLSVM